MTTEISVMYGSEKVNRLSAPLSTTIFVFNLLYLSIKSLLLGMKWVSKNQDLQIFELRFNKCIINFHPLEVVGRGSETQLQVD